VKWYRLEKVSQELGTGFQVEELELEVCDIQRAKPTSIKTTRQEKRKEKKRKEKERKAALHFKRELENRAPCMSCCWIISMNALLSVRVSFCTHSTPVEVMKETHR
jgi:hypothetical protein